MTCQVGPVIGSDTAPVRQPSKSPPIERGGPGDGVNLRANSSLAGVDSASVFFSGGRGLGLSEPGSIGSIKCFSCATAELAAARKRTASRQTTARISNYTPYGSVASFSVWIAKKSLFFCPPAATRLKAQLLNAKHTTKTDLLFLPPAPQQIRIPVGSA